MKHDPSNPDPTIDTGLVDRDNPWPGLEQFHEADHEFFRGRSAESDELLRSVRHNRTVVLHGASGLGKSSLIQAGLFKRVRQIDMLPVYVYLDLSEGAPSPLEQLHDAISNSARDGLVACPSFRADETLWEYFHRKDSHFWSPRNRLLAPLLAFDQFEEIFTKGRSRAPAETHRFLSELADLAEARPPEHLLARIEREPDLAAEFDFDRHHYKVLLALREDFLADVDSLRSQYAFSTRERTRLGPMNGIAALEVVGSAAHLVEPDVAEAVVRFVSATTEDDKDLEDVKIDPALLSLICRELNNKRRFADLPKITLELLEVGQETILRDFYEASLNRLPPAEREQARVFIEDHLVTDMGHRDSVAVERAGDLRLSDAAISELIKARLIRREARLGQPRLELTHDLLTRPAIESRAPRRLSEAQARARARELQELEDVRRSHREARERVTQARRRLRTITVFMAIAVAAAAFGWYQRGQAVTATRAAEAARAEADSLRQVAVDSARIASEQRDSARAAQIRATELQASAIEARDSAQADRDRAAESAREAELSALVAVGGALVVDGRSMLDSDPELSIVLALEAAAILEVASADQSDSTTILTDALLASRVRAATTLLASTDLLRDALNASRVRAVTTGYERTSRGVAFLPGDTMIATASEQGAIELWAWPRLAEMDLSGHSAPVSDLDVYAWAGEVRIASVSTDGTVLVQQQDGGEVNRFSAGAGPRAIALRPDSLQSNAVSLAGSGLTTWDFGSATIMATLPHPPSAPVTDVVYASDRRVMVTAADDGSVRFWLSTSGRRIRTLLQTARISSLDVNHDASRLVVAVADGDTVVVIETEGWSRAGLHVPRHPTTALAFSPAAADPLLAVGDASGTITLLPATLSGPLTDQIQLLGHSGPIRDLDFSADGTRIASGSEDGTVRVWTTTPGDTAQAEWSLEELRLAAVRRGLRTLEPSACARFAAALTAPELQRECR